MAEYEIHHRESGPWGENDEYWTLVVPENGTPDVRYEAFWGNPYKGKVTRPAPETTPLTQFLADHTFGLVHDKLVALLHELKIDTHA